MLESTPRPAIRIGYVAGFVPFVEQEHFVAGVWRQPCSSPEMSARHGEHKIGFAQHVWFKLARAMRGGVDPALVQDLHRVTVHGAPHQCAQTGAADMNIIGITQLLAEQKFRRGATANIADTYN
jgi:hypothetical protein